MKKLILLSSLLSLFFQSPAQTSTDSVSNIWSVGITAYGGGISIPSTLYHENFLKGVLIKRKWKNMNARLSFEQSVAVLETTEPGCCDILYRDGFYNQYYLRLGADRNIYRWNFLSFYGGADLLGMTGKSDVLYEGGFVGVHYRENELLKAVGVSPLLGIQASLGEHVALSFESRYYVYHQTLETTHYNLFTYRSNTHTNSGWIDDLFFGPFIFSVQF